MHIIIFCAYSGCFWDLHKSYIEIINDAMVICGRMEEKMSTKKGKIGVLTSGGDAPGMNAHPCGCPYRYYQRI